MPPFSVRQLRAEGLGQLHNLALTYHTRPSVYLGLTGQDATSLLWAYWVDQACLHCANELAAEKRRSEQEARSGYERVKKRKQ